MKKCRFTWHLFARLRCTWLYDKAGWNVTESVALGYQADVQGCGYGHKYEGRIFLKKVGVPGAQDISVCTKAELSPVFNYNKNGAVALR